MWEDFFEAVRGELKSARIVIDRFHIAKTYYVAVESLCKQKLKRLRSDLTEEVYQQLKGSLWAFRKKNQAS
jgi:transposase